MSREDDDDLARDCRCGWKGSPVIELDGSCWPLDFAAKSLGVPARDLRDLVRIVELTPAGTMRMSPYRRSGRQPRVYDATKLVKLYEAIRSLQRELGTPGPG